MEAERPLKQEQAAIDIGQRWRRPDGVVYVVMGIRNIGGAERQITVQAEGTDRTFSGDYNPADLKWTYLGWKQGHGPQPPTKQPGYCSKHQHVFDANYSCPACLRESAGEKKLGPDGCRLKSGSVAKTGIPCGCRSCQAMADVFAKPFDPNKVCGAHGQPQFILGCVLPCSNPGCGCGVKGESYDFPMAGRDGYHRVRFVRTYVHLTEDTGLWRWKAEPSIPADDQSLAAKLRVDGWEDAIIKQAAKTVEKPVKRGSMPIPAELSGSIMSARQAGKSITAGAMQQANDAQRQALNYGLISGETVRNIQYDELAKLNAETLEEAIQAMQASIRQAEQRAARPLIGLAGWLPDMTTPFFGSPTEAQLTGAKIPDLTNAVMAKIMAKPQKREVSVDGRNWIDYERLADSDAFEVYPHRRIDGKVDAMAMVVKAKGTVGLYGLASGGEIHCAAPRSEFIRAKKPTPWKGSVDDLDLLPDVQP